MAAKGGPASFRFSWNFLTDCIKKIKEKQKKTRKAQHPDDNVYDITYNL